MATDSSSPISSDHDEKSEFVSILGHGEEFLKHLPDSFFKTEEPLSLSQKTEKIKSLISCLQQARGQARHLGMELEGISKQGLRMAGLELFSDNLTLLQSWVRTSFLPPFARGHSVHGSTIRPFFPPSLVEPIPNSLVIHETPIAAPDI